MGNNGEDIQSDVEHLSYKVMRILKRLADGERKVHRTIWNAIPVTEQPK